MKFRTKLTIAMVLLLSLTYGIGGSLMIAQSFSSSIDRERDAAVQTYRMVVDVLDLLGDNASPGTAANTVALVLHKLGSGGSSTAARIRFGTQMTETGDTVLLDAAPEPADDDTGVTRIVRAGNNRHYLMLSAAADGTAVTLAFDVTEAYTVRQTQQRAYHTTFVILIAIGAAVAWLTSYLLTRPLGTLHACQIDILGVFPIACCLSAPKQPIGSIVIKAHARLNHTRIGTARYHAPARIEFDIHGKGKAILVRPQGAQIVRQALGQHGQHAIGQVNTGGAHASFKIDRTLP